MATNQLHRQGGQRKRLPSQVDEMENTKPGLPPRSSSVTTERDPPSANLPADRDANKDINNNITREKDLWKAFEAQEIALSQTKADLETALQAKEEIQREWRQATKDLNRLQAERNYKVDDDFLIAAFKQLRYDIKNWSFQHFDGDLKLSSYNKEPRLDVKLMCRDAKAYINSPRQRPELIQSVVWYQVMTRIFQTDGYLRGLLWAGGEHQQLRTLYGVLDPGSRKDLNTVPSTALKEFHKWRALTANLVEAKASQAAVEHRVKEVSNEINKIVKPYITLKNADCDNGLIKIVAKATQLDCEFNKQRAHIYLDVNRQLPSGLLHSYEAGTNFCECSEEDNGQVVQFCMAPMLLKRGNSDGDGYDQRAILVRSQICLEPPEQPRKQSGQSLGPQVPKKDVPVQNQQSQNLTVPYAQTKALERQPTTSGASFTSRNGVKEHRSNSGSKIKKGLKAFFDPAGQVQ